MSVSLSVYVGEVPRIDGRRVHEWLECAARLSLGDGHVVEPVFRQISAADPRPDVPGARILRNKAHLKPGFAGLEGVHERGIALELLQGGVLRRPASSERREARRLPDEDVKLRLAILPEVGPPVCHNRVAGVSQIGLQVFAVDEARTALSAPLAVDGSLQPVHLILYGLLRQLL